MARRKKREEEEPSRAVGFVLVLVVGSGVLAGIWAAAPRAALLGLWLLATVAVWWSVSRTPNHSPPPPQAPPVEENMQVRVVPGDHPHHWRVIREKGPEQ